MYWTDLSELAAAVDARIDAEFIDSGCRARIETIARGVPAKAAESLGFERRLGQDDTRVDFGFPLNAYGARWLAGADAWPNVRGLVEGAYAKLRSEPVFWLEFDTSTWDGQASWSPSIYLATDAGSTNQATMLALAECLNNCPTTSMPTVGRCVASFPSSVETLYIGAMRSRNVHGIRLSISWFAFHDVLPYLRAVRWPGDVALVESVLAPFISTCSRFGVQLDVAANMKQWLAIELMVDAARADGKSGNPGSDLIALLEREGRCSAYEAAQLANWPSNTALIAPLLDRLMEVRYPRPTERLRHGSLVTAINHFKFSFQNDGSVVTKAYLSVCLEPLED